MDGGAGEEVALPGLEQGNLRLGSRAGVANCSARGACNLFGRVSWSVSRSWQYTTTVERILPQRVQI
jgi:hypothetical protein